MAAASTPSPSAIERSTGAPRAGVNIHLTPTKKRRKNKDGEISNYMLQGRCRMCGKNTTYLCSGCVNGLDCGGNEAQKDPWICHTRNGSMCFANHLSEKHNI